MGQESKVQTNLASKGFNPEVYQSESIVLKGSNADSERKPVNMKRKRYTETQLQQTLNDIRASKITVYRAAKESRISKNTLQYRLSQRFRNGPHTVFSREEEEKISKWLQDMEKRGFPITKRGLILKIRDFVSQTSKKTPFRNNTPGKMFFFVQIHLFYI